MFYSDGQLFQVSTSDASCAPTSYQHPVQQPFNQLGMGFTATVPDSTNEVLYVISPNFGLSTIDIGTMAVTQTNALVMAAELTGGIDAKLFMFAADTAGLAEIDLANLSQAPIHTFSELQRDHCLGVRALRGAVLHVHLAGHPDHDHCLRPEGRHLDGPRSEHRLHRGRGRAVDLRAASAARMTSGSEDVGSSCAR